MPRGLVGRYSTWDQTTRLAYVTILQAEGKRKDVPQRATKYFHVLIMEAESTYESSINFYEKTRCNIPVMFKVWAVLLTTSTAEIFGMFSKSEY